MNDTVDLDDLDLTELGVAVRSFRNLFYHRTVLLEGIRRIAVRNMVHLTDARHHCEAQASPPKEVDWVPRVQARMLSDQGLEDDEYSRIVIAWATFYPLQVYLALLYAEIECARECRGVSTFFDDDQLFPFLDVREEAVRRLRRFRNSFLHPKPASHRLEMEFLTYGDSYNSAPEMQTALDAYLARLNVKLIAALDDLVSRLPKIERLHCTAQALRKTAARMDLHRDVEGLERVVAQMSEFEDEMEGMRDDYRSWTPTARQAATVRALAEYVSEVRPSAKELQTEVPSRRQPPMNPLLLAPLVSGSGGPNRYGDSRVARDTIKAEPFIRRLLIAAAVMTNEAGTWQGGQSLEELLRKGPEEALAELQEEGLHRGDLIAAPSRLSAALLYEPLRVYSELEKHDASVHDDTLSSLVTNVLEPLREFRKCVFHVPDHTKNPIQMDHAVTRALHGTIGQFYSGLAKFFGPGPATK